MNRTSSGQRTIGSNTRREAAYLRRVTTLERKGLYSEAVQALEKAMELVPDKASHCVRLAELYRAQCRMDDAIDALKRAIELDPGDPTTQEGLLQIYIETNRFDEAILESKQLIKRNPRSLFARDVLGAAYLQRGQLDKALLVAGEMIRLNPGDSTNHFKRAVIYHQKGNVSRAIEEFSRVVELNDDCDMSEAAREALLALDGYQLRQIAALACEDTLFYTKLLRDPEMAVLERGFVLSMSGQMMLRQVDFSALPNVGRDSQKYYH